MGTDHPSGTFRHMESGFNPDLKQNVLNISITPDGIAALVVSHEEKKAPYALWHPFSGHTFEFREGWRTFIQTLTSDLPGLAPSKLVLSDHRIILVPGKGFSDEEIVRFFQMAFHPDPEISILRQEIDTPESTAIFPEQPVVIEFLRSRFGNAPLVHMAVEMMAADLSQKSSVHDTSGSVLIAGNSMFVHLYSNLDTHFFNSFTFQTPDELVYYMAAIARNLELDHQTLKLRVTGTSKETLNHTALLASVFPLTKLREPNTALLQMPEENWPRFQLLASPLL